MASIQKLNPLAVCLTCINRANCRRYNWIYIELWTIVCLILGKVSCIWILQSDALDELLAFTGINSKLNVFVIMTFDPTNMKCQKILLQTTAFRRLERTVSIAFKDNSYICLGRSWNLQELHLVLILWPWLRILDVQLQRRFSLSHHSVLRSWLLMKVFVMKNVVSD